MRAKDFIIEQLIVAEGRGLYARTPNDPPFTAIEGNSFGATPGTPYQFVGITNYPTAGGFKTPEEIQPLIAEIEGKLNQQIIWVNRQTKGHKAFGIAEFAGEPGKVFYGKFFDQIHPNMHHKWDNKDVPGLQSELKASKKARAGFKPQDILGDVQTFTTGKQLIQYVLQSPKLDESIKAGIGMISQGQLPRFQGQAENLEAIRDNLGEVLQSLAVTSGIVGGDAEEARKVVLNGAPWNKLGIYFPSGKTYGLVDFYLRSGNFSLGVSSKGGKGAPASVRNLYEGINNAKKSGQDLEKEYPIAAEIISIINRAGMIDGPLNLAVSMGMITNAQADQVKTMIQTHQRDNPPAWTKRWTAGFNADPKKNWNYGYWTLASIAAVVAERVNANPKFSEGCLSFLNYASMMQMYTQAKADKGDVQITNFTAIYPPNFQGTIVLKAGKSYYSSGINQKYVFDFKPQ
jgi:hypothetical protein